MILGQRVEERGPVVIGRLGRRDEAPLPSIEQTKGCVRPLATSSTKTRCPATSAVVCVSPERGRQTGRTVESSGNDSA